MRLKTVSVSGFRSLESVDSVHLGSPTLITGQNDGGKSSLLYAIQFLLNGYAATDRDHTYQPVLVDSTGTTNDSGADGDQDCARCEELIVEGTFVLSPLEQDLLGLPAEARVRRRHLIASTSSHEVERNIPEDPELRDLGSLRVDQLRELCSSRGESSAGLKPDLVERLEALAKSGTQVLEWVAASPALVRALPDLLVFSSENAADADESIRRLLTTTYKAHLQQDDISGLVTQIESQLDQLLAKDVESIIKHVSARCSDVGTVRIQPNSSLTAGVRDAVITVSNASGQDIRLAEAGAGRSRRISLAVWEAAGELLSRQGDTVVIYDEPDTHLDYLHQRELMKVILEQADLSSTRVIVATHSMNLVDGVDIGDVLHFTLDSDRTVVRVLRDETDTGRHLGSIAASLGLRNTTLLHERLFVGVEGITEMACLPILFKLATGKQLESSGIALWACGNNEGAVNFASFLQTHGRNVAFLCDQDSVTHCPKVFAPEKLKSRGFDPDTQALYLGNPNEIEDLFEDHVWSRISNVAWPLPDGRTWKPEDFFQHRGSKFSSEVLNMLKIGSPVGPSSKDDVMTKLALNLSKAELPPDLVDRFTKLQELAAN